MGDKKKRGFWELSCNDVLSIICAAAVPIALGIYTAITYQQEQEQAMKSQQLSINQTIESRQDALYDQFLNNVYNLDKDGYLEESKDPWAFVNAYYRAAHRQLDPLRKGDVLKFLKEKELIGRNNCSSGCNTNQVKDIVRLSELNFDKVHLKSETGILNKLNLQCVVFDQVSMSDATFSFANLNGVSFDRGRLQNANFGNSSLICASFNGTDLEGVDFGESDLQGAKFDNVDLSKVKLTDKQRAQAEFTNIKGSKTTTTRRTTLRIAATKGSSTIRTIPTTTNTQRTTQSSTATSISTTEKPTTTTTVTKTTNIITTTTSTITITTSTSIISKLTTITTSTTTITTSTSTPLKSTTATSTTTIMTTSGRICTGTLITFDDIPGQSSTTGVIPSGYNGLIWTNAVYLNTSTTPVNSIYRTGLRSSPFVIHNTNGGNIQFRKASGTFNLFSFQLTGTLPFPHTVIFQIATNRGSVQLTLSAQDIFEYPFGCGNCIGVSVFTITATYNAAYASLVPTGAHFIIDDVCIS